MKILLSLLVSAVLWVLLTPTLGQTLRDDAQMRSSDVDIPNRVQVGRTYRVSMKVTNNGTTTWQARKYFLRVRIVRGPSGSPTQREHLTLHLELKDPVAPGESHAFSYEIEGPPYLGEYRLEWGMSNGHDDFGDRVTRTIRVVE